MSFNEEQNETKKFKVTRQRQVILEEIRRFKWHPVADELYDAVRKKLPRISMGTVYRTLEMLSEKGMILKLQIPGSPMRFDGTLTPHYHIRCIKCGRVDDIEIEAGVNLDELGASATNYKAVSCNLEFSGICPVCYEKRREKDS